MNDELLLTVPEVMNLLKLGRSTVYDLIRSRHLCSITVGRCRRIPLSAVHAFVADKVEEAA
ncbi:helix-turn-helix domain-containing protein [Streptomyces sp. I05A-00742]|uniref:helix-turn-helix domain-containing protein n=1 Tax=Streptomyces sp. I05A-00742 TaxID=2732853 RepID=UPI001487A421|nr:helix-turn-helix domain-containing protein [Streptomyces sp. I05A-00742]